MSSSDEQKFRFRISLRGLMITILVFGAGLGILGRLFRQNPQIFMVVVAVLTFLVPYLLAIGTIAWYGAKRKRLGLCLWALLLFLLPFVGTITILVTNRYAGQSPGNLELLGTKQLIEVELPKQIDAPWVWRVLEQRQKSGKLSQEEADAAVGQLIAFMKSTKPAGWDQPLSWQRDFLAGIDRAGLLSDEVKFDLCDAFYGADPRIQPLPRLREGSQNLDINIEYGSNWDDHTGLDLSLLWHIDRVLLDGAPIEVEQNHKYGSRWSGRYNGPVAVGEHELTFEMTCAYVDKAKLLGLDAARLPPERWPIAAKQWNRKVSAPLNLFASDDSIVRLTTDAGLDPSSSIKVKRCVVQADEGGKKKIILEIEMSPKVATSCDISISLAGQFIPLGSQWISPHENGRTSGGSGLNAVIESLDPVIAVADVTLTPNPKHIEQRPEVTEIWGKPITLFSVPVERLDLEIQQTAE